MSRKSVRSKIIPFATQLSATPPARHTVRCFVCFWIQKQTKQRTVCLAGGVALNCVANGMIFDRTDFRDIYIQPAAHDAGTSIGAALYVHHQVLDLPRTFVDRKSTRLN